MPKKGTGMGCYAGGFVPWLVFFAGVFLLSAAAFAQDVSDQELPQGMELRVVGSTSLIVPKGAEVTENNGLLVVEAVDRYMARSLNEMRMQLETFEARQLALDREVESLKKTLEELRQEKPE